MTTSPPPAGWYPDPGMADTRRYWNGSGWTDHIAAGAGQSSAPRGGAMVVIGWICAVMVPPVGLGVALSLPREQKAHQAWMVTVSAVLTFTIPIVWFVLTA